MSAIRIVIDLLEDDETTLKARAKRTVPGFGVSKVSLVKQGLKDEKVGRYIDAFALIADGKIILSEQPDVDI